MKVNRKQTLQEAIDSLGYEYTYINPDVELKNEGDEEVELEFFNLGKYATPEEVRAEYEKRDAVPDFFGTVEYLKEHPEVLKKKRYIAIQLEGDCYATFRCWLGKRCVNVRPNVSKWDVGWWFPCRRKSSKSEKLNTQDTLGLELPDVLTINGVEYIRK